MNARGTVVFSLSYHRHVSFAEKKTCIQPHRDETKQKVVRRASCPTRVSVDPTEQDAANTLLPLYNTCQLLFSGLLIRRVNIPSGWKWWTHTLFVRYGWQAQLMNHFGRDKEPKAGLASFGKEKTEYILLYASHIFFNSQNAS